MSKAREIAKQIQQLSFELEKAAFEEQVSVDVSIGLAYMIYVPPDKEGLRPSIQQFWDGDFNDDTEEMLDWDGEYHGWQNSSTFC